MFEIYFLHFFTLLGFSDAGAEHSRKGSDEQKAKYKFCQNLPKYDKIALVMNSLSTVLISNNESRK